MIYNYIKLAYRNLIANKTVSLINIFGLSIAVASAVTVFLFLRNFWTFDRFHVNGERIFMVEYSTELNGDTQTYGDAPEPLATALETEFSQVEQVVRMQVEGVRAFRNENTFDERLTYVDTGFFRMFTFPLAYGNPAALSDPNALVLSHDMAEKYFPGQQPIGQPFTVVTEDQERKQFTVQAVAAPFPGNQGFEFSLLTGYHPVHRILKNPDWTTHLRGLFVMLRNPADAEKVRSALQPYAARYNAANPDDKIGGFLLDNLRHPAPRAYDVNRRPSEANHPLLTLVFALMVLVMLGLSSFNYINISLGTVSKRLKEIGVRKVMGGSRKQLIAQFMAENLLLCAGSLVAGLLLTYVVFLPWMNELMVRDTEFQLAGNWPLWGFLFGLLLLTALASGAYPALYISAFKPASIFSGKLRFGDRNTFRRALLTAQFVLAFIAVITGVVLVTTGKKWEALTWGYEPAGMIVVPLTDSTQYGLLKNELGRLPEISGIAGARSHIGQSYARERIRVDEQEEEVLRLDVGTGYLEIMGLGLREGRFFETAGEAENDRSVLINETFAARHGWDHPVGKQIRVGTDTRIVAGVVRDFKVLPSGAARPVMFFPAKQPDFGFLIARYTPGADAAVQSAVDRSWNNLFAGIPVNRYYQKDVFDSFYQSVRNMSTSFGYVALLALLIACLGLYGLAAQHFSRRLKEVSVRKVMGATVSQIILLVNREFLFLLLIAGGIATAIGFAGSRLLFHAARDFTGSYQPGLWPFLLADVIVLLTAAAAVGYQSWKMAHVKLALTLKNNE